jgi:hypothetical protein
MPSEPCAHLGRYATCEMRMGSTSRNKSYLLAAPFGAADEAADFIGIVWRFGRGIVVCDWVWFSVSMKLQCAQLFCRAVSVASADWLVGRKGLNSYTEEGARHCTPRGESPHTTGPRMMSIITTSSCHLEAFEFSLHPLHII